MKKTVSNSRIYAFIGLFALAFLHINPANAVNYYVDRTDGDDNATGQSPEQAWSSLDKVNGTTFQPGDTIFFRSDEIWIGTLEPKGSGTVGNPIVIDRYGEGRRPRFDGNSLTDKGVLYFENQSEWVIKNLEIMNNAGTPGMRRGVEICGRNGGLLTGFHLINLHVHHIKGLVGNGMTEKMTGGIFFVVYEDDEVPTRFDDLLVESCEIHDCDNQGIVTLGIITYPDPSTEAWQNRKFTNVVIRKNIIYNISKNAMILRMFDGGLVERNLCYSTATGTTGNTIFTRSSRKVVLQYNEGYDNQSPKHDGSLYDADMQSVECIYQYSYSHDNAHGLYWQCTERPDFGNVIRYNISQNDKGRIFNFSYPSQNTDVYNNTVYIGSHRSPIIIGEKTLNGGKRNYTFRNNLIINESESSSYIFVSDEFIGKRIFSNNLFYGHHPEGEPSDPNKVTDDPLLINPGTAEDIEDLKGYYPTAESPVIDGGIDVENNGGVDFFGNPVSSPPDIGAVEYQNVVSFRDDAVNKRRQMVLLEKTTNVLHMTVSDMESGTYNVELVDLQGKVVQCYKQSIIGGGEMHAGISLKKQLNPGIYFVQIRQSNDIVRSQAFCVLADS